MKKRKPGPIRIDTEHVRVANRIDAADRQLALVGTTYLDMPFMVLTPHEARRLADWLTRFADWADEQ